MVGEVRSAAAEHSRRSASPGLYVCVRGVCSHGPAKIAGPRSGSGASEAAELEWAPRPLAARVPDRRCRLTEQSLSSPCYPLVLVCELRVAVPVPRAVEAGREISGIHALSAGAACTLPAREDATHNHPSPLVTWLPGLALAPRRMW